MPTLYISPCAGEVIAASSASSVAYVPLMSRPVPVSPFSPVSPLSPVLPVSPFEPLEPFFTLKVLVLPLESVTVTMFSPPSAAEVVVCSTLVTLTPSAPFAPVAPVSPVAPFSPVSPLSPFSRVNVNSTPLSLIVTSTPGVSPSFTPALGLPHLLAREVMALTAAVNALNSLVEITSSSSYSGSVT